MRYVMMGVLLLAACDSASLGSRKQRALDSAAAAAAPVDTGITVAGPKYYQDSSVTWDALQRIIRSHPDSILAVQQTRGLQVSVAMRNGLKYQAREPVADAIIQLLREVDPAGRILIATE
jgi:hypothetical protein